MMLQDDRRLGGRESTQRTIARASSDDAKDSASEASLLAETRETFWQWMAAWQASVVYAL